MPTRGSKARPRWARAGSSTKPRSSTSRCSRSGSANGNASLTRTVQSQRTSAPIATATPKCSRTPSTCPGTSWVSSRPCKAPRCTTSTATTSRPSGRPTGRKPEPNMATTPAPPTFPGPTPSAELMLCGSCSKTPQAPTAPRSRRGLCTASCGQPRPTRRCCAASTGEQPQPLDPDTYRCETIDGVPLEPTEAAANSLPPQWCAGPCHRRRRPPKSTWAGPGRSKGQRARDAIKSVVDPMRVARLRGPRPAKCEGDHLHEHCRGMAEPAPATGPRSAACTTDWKQKGFSIRREPGRHLAHHQTQPHRNRIASKHAVAALGVPRRQ